MKTHHERGIKAGVAPRTMLPRVSRHGKPLADVYTVLVPAVTERKTLLNPDTDQYEVVTVETAKAYFRPMTAVEMPTSGGWRKQASK